MVVLEQLEGRNNSSCNGQYYTIDGVKRVAPAHRGAVAALGKIFLSDQSKVNKGALSLAVARSVYKVVFRGQ